MNNDQIGWWCVIGHTEGSAPMAAWTKSNSEAFAVEDFIGKARAGMEWDGDGDAPEVYVDVVVFCGQDRPIVSIY